MSKALSRKREREFHAIRLETVTVYGPDAE
jgi:hypothetical protein